MKRPEREAAAGAGPVRDALRITDGRTGRQVDLPAARGVLLRMSVHVPCADATAGAAELRALLVGDVLLRVAEADGVQVMHVLTLPQPPREESALTGAMSALGVHPPAAGIVSPSKAEAALGGPPDVDVFCDDRRNGGQGVWLEVGQVQQGPDVAPALREALSTGDGHDPLALRLALLGGAHRARLTLLPRHLADAARTLERWRRAVARWADSPSKPVPRDIHARLRAAFADDLDLPAVLRTLHRVEAAEDIAAGAKFEVFAHADRILALDLVRDVGRV